MSRGAPASPDAQGVGRDPFASRRSPLNETEPHTSHTRVTHCVTRKRLNTRRNTGITQGYHIVLPLCVVLLCGCSNRAEPEAGACGAVGCAAPVSGECEPR
eukprot:2439629-Prymnesium_polylepis.1